MRARMFMLRRTCSETYGMIDYVMPIARRDAADEI